MGDLRTEYSVLSVNAWCYLGSAWGEMASLNFVGVFVGSQRLTRFLMFIRLFRGRTSDVEKVPE